MFLLCAGGEHPVDIAGEHVHLDIELLALGDAAEGGFVETVFPEQGRYALVSHAMVDAERGAHGVVQVTG